MITDPRPRPLGIGQVPAAVELMSREMGAGYVTEDGLMDLIRGGGLVLAARARGGVLAGVVTTIHPDLVKTVVVAPEWRRRGIGTALLAEATHRLATAGADEVRCLAWVRRGGFVPAARLLVRAGFHPIRIIPEAWREDSLRRGYACPDCGHPCVCSAVEYRIEWSALKEGRVGRLGGRVGPPPPKN